MDFDLILAQVCDIAVATGEMQARERRRFDTRAVERKGAHDYVSYVDKESERLIVERLHTVLPQAAFLTEEKTTEQDDGSGGYLWIVDPLDGTTNYIHDLSPWCVSIALRDDEGLLLGVVYEPVRRELFYAWRGHGAFMRDALGEVSRLRASAVDDLDQALVVVGFPYNADEFRDFATESIHRLYGSCASIRSLGSAEIELCYVAAGRIDVYFESYLKPWDVSAGALIVMEAGGRVSDYEGTDRLWHDGRQMLATNALLHDAVVDMFCSL